MELVREAVRLALTGREVLEDMGVLMLSPAQMRSLPAEARSGGAKG